MINEGQVNVPIFIDIKSWFVINLIMKERQKSSSKMGTIIDAPMSLMVRNIKYKYPVKAFGLYGVTSSDCLAKSKLRLIHKTNTTIPVKTDNNESDILKLFQASSL